MSLLLPLLMVPPAAAHAAAAPHVHGVSPLAVGVLVAWSVGALVLWRAASARAA